MVVRSLLYAPSDAGQAANDSFAAIGTGLVIGSGTGLSRCVLDALLSLKSSLTVRLRASAGPVGILIGYSVMGAICFSVMISLGEMATYLPHRTFSCSLAHSPPPPLPFFSKFLTAATR